MANAEATITPEENWDLVSQSLILAGVNPLKIKQLKIEWKRYKIERMSSTNLTVQLARDWVVSHLPFSEDISLCQFANESLALFRSETNIQDAILSDRYVTAMKLFEYMEHDQHTELQEIDSQSQEEE